MNKKMSKKATGLLLVSQLTLSMMPITALATEEHEPVSPEVAELIQSNDLLSDLPSAEIVDPDETNQPDNVEEEQLVPESEESPEELVDPVEAEEQAETEELQDSEPEIAENHETEVDESEEIEAAEAHLARNVVQVSTNAQLRTALANANVTQIHLANSITMSSSVTWTGTTKSIEGNGHTLTFANNVRLYGNTVNQGLSISNVRIVSRATDTIYQNRTSSVSFTNVIHENSHATGRLLYLNGNNSSVNFLGQNQINAGSLIWANANSRVNVDTGASVHANNNGTARAIHLTNGGQINLASNSLLDVSQNNSGNKVKAVLIEGSSSRVAIASGATFKISSAPNTQKTQEALGLRGSLHVSSGGTLDVVGRSTFSAINLGQSSTFEEGSNVRIQNNHRNGSAIGSYPGTTNYTIRSSRGIQTWARGANFSGDPTFNYQEFNQGSFSVNSYLIKQITSQIQSNDARFNATFNSGRVGKIVTGNFVAGATIQQTTIDELTTASTQITGQAEPNASLTITIEGQPTLTGRVGSDGTYQVTIPANVALSVGTKVSVTATINGLTSVAETIVGDSEKATLAETTISDLNTDSTSVTGTAEPNAEIIISAGEITLATGRVGSDGIYALTIERQEAGTVVTAQATLDGVSSNIAETIVVRATIAATTLNEVTTTSTTVTGTAEPNAQIEIKVDGDVIATGTVDNDGEFELEIDPQPLGTVILAQASIDGLTSNIASTVVVIDPASTEGTITPNKYNVSSGNLFLTGGYTGHVVSARVHINGVSVRGGTFADGKFEFFVGNRIQSVDDVVEIEALDQNGRVLDRQRVELERDLAGTITPAQYRVGEATITGSFTGDVNLARLIINGTSTNVWGGTFNPDGTFSFFVGNLNIKAEDKVEIQALNRQVSGNSEAIEVLDVKEVPVIAQLRGTLTPNRYRPTETTITGTFSGDINFANLLIDGESVGNWGGTFDQEAGTFEFFVHARYRDRVREAAKVEIKTFHRERTNGQTVDHRLVRQPVEVVRGAGTITPEPFKVTENLITGSFTGDINLANLIIDGQSVSWGGTFNTSTKTFTYFVNQTVRHMIRDAEKVELVGYQQKIINGRPVETELDRSILSINREFTGTITPDDYRLGSRVITGTYTGEDINFGRLDIDGLTLWVSAFADGKFTAYLNATQASSITKESKVTIYGVHRFRNQSTEIIAKANVTIVE
ncbi:MULTISPECIES: immunoglobulin-like domain-containing protein [unclassified Enterococcus]|uniref:immunoglobulin-like domain-containing protein n=2 Tax=Enterococcus TaxID=1350 RepID=UPI001A9B918A|nr:immunoglobulin-like domain-containing protein [Enterococcus sp. DIV1271a]MBO1298686.1 autolysin modifier protein [Enterococcus sp. DIV1271a]